MCVGQIRGITDKIELTCRAGEQAYELQDYVHRRVNGSSNADLSMMAFLYNLTLPEDRLNTWDPSGISHSRCPVGIVNSAGL